MAGWRRLLLAGLVLVAASGRAQLGSGVATDFKLVLEWYPAPHFGQMKSLLQGARAEPLPDGRNRITGGRLQTFLETGEPQIKVTAPEAIHDRARNIINSAGHLRVETSDGKFSIDGDGFLWQQTNSVLYISNNVHTTVQPDLLEPKSAQGRPGAATAGLDIFSHQFRYSGITGEGVYREKVRVAGTNLLMTGGILTVKLPVKERRLESITNQDNVVLDYTNADHERIHATGEKAVYAAATDTLWVTGHPTWQTEQREGSGDDLLLDRTNKFFRTTGHAWLKIINRSSSGASFLPQLDLAATNSAPATNQTVDIYSDSYELRTNLAVFRSDVRLTQRAGRQLKGKMDCGLLTIALSRSNQVQKMVAEKGVVIEQEDKRFTGGKAVYTAVDPTNGVMELTEHPTWRAGPRQGKGDVLRVDARQSEMTVEGNASMRFPATELAPPGTNVTGAVKPGHAAGATNQFADVFSKEYTLRREKDRVIGRFLGGVRIHHPQLNLTNEAMTVELPPEGREVQRIVAERGVKFDLMDERGQKHHGEGVRLVYTHTVSTTATNDLVVLIGSPATLQTTNGPTARNNVFNLDLTSGVISGSGRYEFTGTTSVDTNKFKWPKR